jgi:alkaline phosphatase D
VASGDPLPDRVILWTRLAPKPLEGGGMPQQDVDLTWEVAEDEGFRELKASGTTTTTPRWGHSAHVDATGLEPDTWYWYRFRLGDETSPVGRTRTAPAADATIGAEGVRFGFGSCQEWTNGYYTAYPHLVDEKLDLMVWLGDYIYEGGIGGDDSVRKHNSAQVVTLDEYRNRYGLYNGDPNLQAARAAQPWVVLWDDHEVENNYADDSSNKGGDPAAFRQRRAAAYQAWWENQPVRMDPPIGPDLQIYRTLGWGQLVNFFVLDERQYRSAQICGNQLGVGNCADKDDPSRTMLGTEQRDWFFGELDKTKARWNVIANEVIMAKMPIAFGDPPVFNIDQWDGYSVERQMVVEKLASRPDLNPLVITGDIHAFGMADLKTSWDATGPVVAAEFVGGSITSAFPLPGDARVLLAGADSIHYATGEKHGYAVMHLTEDEARCRFRAVDTVAVETSPASTIAEFVVKPGSPAAQQVEPTT